MNAVYKWGWFGGSNTDCGCDSLYAAYFGTGLLLSYLVRCRRTCSLGVLDSLGPPQFLFIDFFVKTYQRGAERRRAKRMKAKAA